MSDADPSGSGDLPGSSPDPPFASDRSASPEPAMSPDETVRDEQAARDQQTRTAVISIGVVAVIVLIGGLLIGWSRSGEQDDSSADIAMRAPVEAPAIVLTTTEGEPFNFADEVRGTHTMVYLGYLNCPDACPITMNVLSRTMANLTAAQREQFQVVFVTTDPERDSPPEIREYLDSFDPTFIGLTAEPAELAELQRVLLTPAAVKEDVEDDGNYRVGHATSVFLFEPDGVARVRYPFGTRQADWQRIIVEYLDERNLDERG